MDISSLTCGAPKRFEHFESPPKLNSSNGDYSACFKLAQSAYAFVLVRAYSSLAFVSELAFNYCPISVRTTEVTSDSKGVLCRPQSEHKAQCNFRLC